MSNAQKFKYLLDNEQDEQWGLTINTVGFQKVEKGENYPLKQHPASYLFSTEKGRTFDEYQLLYITRGKGWFISEHCERSEIKEGNIFMLFPGEWHNFSSEKNTGWDEYCIGFRGINIDHRMKHGFFSLQNPIFRVGINEEIINIYKKAIVVANEQETGFQQMLAGIVNYLLGMIYSIDKHTINKESIYYNDINKAKVFMQENFHTNLSSETVAEMLNFSYVNFRKIFKEFTGFAPNQYILELKIKKSKELLTKTQQPIKEIAYAVGFSNLDYFYTFFKNKTNYSPKEYRIFTQGDTVE